MPEWSRRRALHAVATASAVTLAGCGATTSGSSSIAHDGDAPVTEFEARLLRNTDGEPLVVSGERATGDRSGDDAAAARNAGVMEHLTDEEDLGDLEFRDVAGGAELESFVTATDLDARSVYLLQRPIGECYAPRLVGVYRERDGVDAQFCRELRPAGVACDADAHDVFAVAIRLPFAGDDFNSVGSGSSSDCDHRPTVTFVDRGESG